MDVFVGLLILFTAATVAYAFVPLTSTHVDSLSQFILASTLCGTLLLPPSRMWSPVAHRLAIYAGCAILGLSSGLSLIDPSKFSYFILLFCYFHFSEFALISVSHGQARFDSLLLNHGTPYASSFVASLFEHSFSPFIVRNKAVLILGAFVAILGLTVRALALITAGKAFTHLISTKRESSHKLTTSGIYRYIRHPGYCGWFYWVVGGQILAGNPICATVFGIVTWIFFRDRIEYEESVLISMFGTEYDRYRLRTKRSGVPFIS